jgi:hypothetical protein
LEFKVTIILNFFRLIFGRPEQIRQIGSIGDPIPISFGFSVVQSGRQGTWEAIKSDSGEFKNCDVFQIII